MYISPSPNNAECIWFQVTLISLHWELNHLEMFGSYLGGKLGVFTIAIRYVYVLPFLYINLVADDNFIKLLVADSSRIQHI